MNYWKVQSKIKLVALWIFFCLSPVLISTSLETFMRIYTQICIICNINMATLAKHFLSWVKRTAFPEPGLHTRAISLRHKGYRSQFFFLEPILLRKQEKTTITQLL